MNLFVVNIFLAFGWAAIQEEVTFSKLLVGYLVGYFVLLFTWPLFDKTRYFSKFWKVLFLPLYFLYELLISSFKVAVDTLRPTFQHRAGIVAIPLDAKTDLEITLLSCLVTLTPGTITLDVSRDRKTLFIHSMFAKNPDEVRSSIKNGMEKLVLEVMR